MSGVILTMGVAHLSRADLAPSRAVRRMVNKAMGIACTKARDQGGIPIAAVDDLTVHSLGPWVDNFGKHLAGAASRNGVSVVGGEMAQMPDTYAAGYAGVVISVVSLRSAPLIERE